MSSPNPPFDCHVELFVSGAWTDVSGFVYDRNLIQIIRGRSSETATKVDPANCTFTLDDRSGNFSTRNPNSTYYPTLKRNTPARVSVNDTGGTHYRFWGEIAGITPSADISGKDLTSAVEAGGVLRRLGQGNQIVRSRPRSYIPTTSPTAYWPMEDGPLATQGVAAVGSAPMKHVGTTPQTWGTNALAPWLAPTVTGVTGTNIAANDGIFAGPVTAVHGHWTVDYLFSGNASHSIAISGDVGNIFGPNAWTLSYTPSITTLQVTPPVGFSPQTVSLALPTNQFHHVRFDVFDFGSDDVFTVWIDGVQVFTGTVTSSAPTPAPLAIVFSANPNGTINSTGVTFGHIAFYGAGNAAPSLAATVLAANGSPGELAGNRISRICGDLGVTLTTVGNLNVTQPCGPQYATGIIDLLNETADVDGGIPCETIGSVGLTYQTREATYNEAVALPLTYTTSHHLAAPLAPVDDDQTLRNDVTVTRKAAGPQRAIQTTGPLSTSAPPTGVGSYTDSLTINCLTDAQALDQAGWRALNVGTWNEARFPSLKFDLRVLPLAQRAQLLVCNIGSRVTITSPPTWLPPDQIDLLIVGLKETVTRFRWDIELVCQPFGPYRVAVADSATLARPSPNSGASTVTCTSGAASWSVATSSGPLWTTAAADFPLDVMVEGERVTVTNITGGSSPQTFTVTRSINGIAKSHTAATVDLFQLMIAAM